MKKYVYLFVVLGLSVIMILQGCASNASADRMIVQPMFTAPPSGNRLKENILVGEVTGGQETNPLWMSRVNNAGIKVALEESLKIIDFYGFDGKANYQLNAALLEIKQSGLVSYTVTCTIQYVLIDIKTSRSIYKRKISSTYMAPFGEDLLGVTRLKDANEGAIKANISKLIMDLYRLR